MSTSKSLDGIALGIRDYLGSTFAYQTTFLRKVDRKANYYRREARNLLGKGQFREYMYEYMVMSLMNDILEGWVSDASRAPVHDGWKQFVDFSS